MKLDVVIRRQGEAKTRLRDLMSRAVFYGMSHEQFLTEQQKLFVDLKRLPRYAKDFLRGYAARETDRWYESELAWCHVAPDGTLYAAHVDTTDFGFAQSVDPLYNAGRGAEIATWKHGHYWIAASKRASQYGQPPKLFFDGSSN